MVRYVVGALLMTSTLFGADGAGAGGRIPGLNALRTYLSRVDDAEAAAADAADKTQTGSLSRTNNGSDDHSPDNSPLQSEHRVVVHGVLASEPDSQSLSSEEIRNRELAAARKNRESDRRKFEQLRAKQRQAAAANNLTKPQAAFQQSAPFTRQEEMCTPRIKSVICLAGLLISGLIAWMVMDATAKSAGLPGAPGNFSSF